MKKLNYTTSLMMAVLVAMLLGGSGCIITTEPPCSPGYDGRPGQAFLELDWTNHQPDYLWTNNTAIPAVFRYGNYYESWAGTYDLYYEGTFYDGCCPVDYFWDVVFEIWIHPGTLADCGYNGLDGADSFLSLVLDPYGPIEYRTNKTGEGAAADDMKILSQTDKEIVVEKTVGDITMRATYKKLDKSRKAELDSDNVKVGSK